MKELDLRIIHISHSLYKTNSAPSINPSLPSFTYHIVYIKQFDKNKVPLDHPLFTYHIVYIKHVLQNKFALLRKQFTYHIVYIKHMIVVALMFSKLYSHIT